MTFTLATPGQLSGVCALYRRAVDDMLRRGLQQWRWGDYPREAVLADDIAHGWLYAACEGDEPVCCFVLRPDWEPEGPEYVSVPWLFGGAPVALHRVAVAPERAGSGLGREALAFALREAARLGYAALRTDTFSRNERALGLFSTHMERRAGEIFFPRNPVAPYVCFETRLDADAPLLPVPMTPAYRCGDSTPWGGSLLREVYGKQTPDPRTGESLEISAIPGLNSTGPTGTPLDALLRQYGETLSGPAATGAFPLLLKLIDARDALSVQVHPDDAYAAAREGGKLGKSEAWVILRAEENAAILYGMNAGVTREALRRAVDEGRPLGELIRRAPVRAGDVFYIQSGMVHAIGPGILLYEIQQSSDVTYRFWDYDRTNARGEKRPLHLRQAMDVVDTALAGRQTALPDARDAGLHAVLRVPAFALLCACVQGELPLPEHGESFRMLTALDALTLCRKGGELPLRAGQSVLLPARCPALRLRGEGRALLAQP